MNTITRIIAEVHRDLMEMRDGDLADYIPQLATVDPDRFGIALTTPDGHRHEVGDTDVSFTIQSVSKAFVYGLVLDAVGIDATGEHVDLEPSGDAFNEISLDPITSKPMNAMINVGAIAITSLVPGGTVEERFEWLIGRMGAFAGRPLDLDHAVYESERDTGHRNRAIGHLLRSGGIVGDRLDEDLDLYFRQCSILVTCSDLSAMGATLAHGGVNPVTGERVLSDTAVERVLSVMASSGMYDWSGSWIAEVGLPAKSGVGGGIVAVLPGQLAVAVHSPRLDRQGNSARGIAAFREMSRRFNLHLFNTPTLAGETVRRTYRLSESGSSRRRPVDERHHLEDVASSVAIVEVQGDLFFAAIERLSRAIDELDDVESFVLDCSRVGLVDPRVPELIGELAADIFGRGHDLVIVDPDKCLDHERVRARHPIDIVDGLNAVLEDAEERLLGGRSWDQRVMLEASDLFRSLDPGDVGDLRREMSERVCEAGEVLCRTGEPGDAMYVLTSGRLDIRTGPGIIASVSPGACVGEIAVIAGGRRSADVVAAVPSTCFVLSLRALTRIEAGRPRLYTKIIRNVLLMNLEHMRHRAVLDD